MVGAMEITRQARERLRRGAKAVVRRLPDSADPRKLSIPRDIDAQTSSTVRKVLPYTMTSVSRVVALCDAVQYISRNEIPGDVVECGVWRGGSMMAVAETLLSLGEADRQLYLFDTFEGMSEPTAHDLRFDGAPAQETWEERRQGDGSDWCRAGVNDVATNMRRTGYPDDKVHLIAGKVEDTIPEHAPSSIALLRLDTDWYESTKHELDHLFDRISPKGVLIIDDYGYWQGARRAVDEFIAERGLRLYLHRVDASGRLAVLD